MAMSQGVHATTKVVEDVHVNALARNKNQEEEVFVVAAVVSKLLDSINAEISTRCKEGTLCFVVVFVVEVVEQQGCNVLASTYQYQTIPVACTMVIQILVVLIL